MVSGQSGFRNESEMKANAAEYFAKDQFILAFPLYSQLLSLDSQNPELNYRFGVCLMYTDRANTEEPIIYLEKAINKISDIDLYYHLAVAYHNNYFFTDAIYNYRKYLQLAKNKARKDYDVSHKIAMCQNGIELLRAVDDLYVIEKSEVEKKAFYRSYNLMDYGGRILNLPKEFLNKVDQKDNEDHIAYFNPNAKLLFYAINKKNQKDIYYRIQQKDKEWSPAIALSSKINTEYDEDYPIFMPDGKTLYFSSKGHNSMGGFDIFQSTFDSITDQWSEPVNLSFPFNTPADDILFISNSDETIAWFASNRSSKGNKISVYKVGIIKKNKQVANLSNVYSKDNLSDNDLGKIKNMALLDINISDKAFREIPVEQTRKLDALTKNDAARITQNIRQTNLINVDKQIAVREMQTDLTDSIKKVILKIDSKLETLKSLYLQTQYLATSKAGSSKQGYVNLSLQLENAQKATSRNQKKELLKKANQSLFKTLRLNFEYEKLNEIEQQIDNQISAQRNLLFQATALFGDIQKTIATQNEKETRKNITLLDKLIRKADTLTDYTRIVDYSKGELFYPNYPSNLLNERSFSVYYLENERNDAPILTLDSRFASYIPVATKLATNNKLRQNESTESIHKGKTISTPASPLTNKPKENRIVKDQIVIKSPSEQIREELSALNQLQADRLDWLKQQSALLTKKASEKLDASNSALLDFENAREQYNKGIINDQNSVLEKQKISQDLLYQSLAIIGFAEKTDSLYKVEQKRNEESTNAIFAIEQALQSDQIENAKSQLVSLENTLDNPIFSQENLVLDWIKSSINGISSQRKLANIAFESSQQLTDESMQLLLEVQDLKENAKTKSNAFKRRQITIKAEEKEELAGQKQANADQQLAIGTNLNEEIKKAEAILQIADEFSASDFLSQNSKLIVNPEKRMAELNARLEAREQGALSTTRSEENALSQEISPKLYLGKIPKMNDLIAYSTKLLKAQLLAEELDINKRETVQLLEIGKTLNRVAARENAQKIVILRKEADSLQNASILAFNEAGEIYKLLSPEDKNNADKGKNNFENYLKNIRNRIAQLLDEVTLLGEQAGNAKEETSRENLKRQADEKEQIAMYLILEEFDIIAQRNKQNYRKNSLIINKLSLEAQSNKEKELMQAIFDQIENFILLAENKRSKAVGAELSFSLKRVLLQDAFSYESSALDLQLEAIRMMREKDIESMLAYQDTEVSDRRHKQETPIANTNLAIKDNKKLVIPNTPIQEKRNTKTETTANTNNNVTNSLYISNNAVNSTKIFPTVSLSQEPKGTLFSVQIAAISRLKTIDNFLNAMDLFSIKDSEKELYRYFSGKFTALKAAIIRRNSLRQQGYSDAFIKSWKNGKIVNLFEAAGTIDEATLALLNKTNISLPSIYRTINFSATNISQLTGVYYSVQVGVYSRPRSSANLFGIKPLYHSRLQTGLWVYFNGIFKSISDAEENKTTVRSKGVPDAFVVAFNEGEKVSLVNARKAISQGVSYPANEDIIILEDASNKVDAQLKTIAGQGQTTSTHKTYKIQIGVFSHPISYDWLSSRLNNSQNKIDYIINDGGKYVYTLGSFGSYEDAHKFKIEKVKNIIKDAFIVTFENGKKVKLSN